MPAAVWRREARQTRAIGQVRRSGPIELRPIGPDRLTWPIALVWRASRRQTAAGKAFLMVALSYADRDGDTAEPPVLRAA